MEVFAQSAVDVIPIYREELFKDVLHNRVYGEISAAWHYPGHLFVTTGNGEKLFTFDCKPVSHQHVFSNDCLDITNVSSPFVGVFMVSEHTVLLVSRSACAFVYRYGDDSSWSLVEKFDLTPSALPTEVISVTFAPGSRSLVWCEQHQAASSSSGSSSSSQHVYSIYRRMFTSSLDLANLSSTSTAELLIHRCPPCNVVLLANDVLFITTGYNKDQVTVHMVVEFAPSLLTLYVGDEASEVTFAPSHGVIEFQELLMSCLSAVIKGQAGQGDLGIQSDLDSRQVAIFGSCGALELFQYVKGSVESDGWNVQRRIVDLSTWIKDWQCLEKKQWIIKGHILGIITAGCLYLIDLKDKSLKCRHDGMGHVREVIASRSPAFLAWVVTSSNMLALQVRESKEKGTSGLCDQLADDNLLPSGILKLAQLHQMKVSSYDIDVIHRLGKANSSLKEIISTQGHSQLAQSITPYLEEYWNLENLSKTFRDIKDSERPPPVDTVAVFVSEMMRPQGESRTDQHAKLLWLSQVHPQELLDYLCQGISIDSDLVTEGEMRAWQRLLGLDGGDLTLFEFACRILFLHHPEKLFDFVKSAESASECSVGVSAFVRKKQTLVYNKAAVDCLPGTQMSIDPSMAALTKAKLILTSCCENCVERSLKCLLSHGMWSEAMALLKEQASQANDMLPTYLHLTINALAQSQVLSNHVKDIFSIMPSWKSFISFAQIASERPEVRQQQLSNSASSVFSSDCSLGSVKSHLMELIRHMDTSQN